MLKYITKQIMESKISVNNLGAKYMSKHCIICSDNT